MQPKAGHIYLVKDDKVAMPPEGHRTFHNQRAVLVVSGNTFNMDESWPIVMVCPVSSGPLSSPHDVRLGASVGGLTKKGFARIALIQPFEKAHLGDLMSLDPIPAALLTQVHSRLVQYLQPGL